MTLEFRPNQTVLISSTVAALFLVSVMFLSVLMSGNSPRSIVEAFILLFVPVVTFCASMFFTKIYISGNKIEVLIMLFYRRKADISDITHVTHRSTFLGSVDIIELHYKTGLGGDQPIRISVNAYGRKQTHEILSVLRQHNSQIRLDEYTKALLENRSQ